jgi:trk system potassium uptake protein TrkA
MKKSIIVLGLGRFGTTVAKRLYENDMEVMAIDKDYNKVQKIASSVTTAIQADITDEEALKELGISNFDIAVIATGRNLEASIEATLICKDNGVGTIIAKATSETHARILEKIGTDKIVYPELDTGNRLARVIARSNLLDLIQFSSESSLAEIKVRKEWVGKSLKELKFRNNYDINVVAFKRGEKIIVSPVSDIVIEEDDIMLIIGKTGSIEKLEEKE